MDQIFDENSNPNWDWISSSPNHKTEKYYTLSTQNNQDSLLTLDDEALYGTNLGFNKRRVISYIEQPFKDLHSPLSKSASRFLSHSSHFKPTQLQNSQTLSSVNFLLRLHNFPTFASTPSTLQVLQKLKQVLKKSQKSTKPSPQNSFLQTDQVSYKRIISIYQQQNQSNKKDILKLQKQLAYKTSTQKSMKDEYNRKISELANKITELQQRKKQMKKTQAEETLEAICQILSLKNPNHAAQAVEKLQKVMRAVPKLQKFIRDVCYLVLPEQDSSQNEHNKKLEQILPVLKSKMIQLNELKYFKERVCESIGINLQSELQEVLNTIKSQDSVTVDHFSRLFEIQQREQVNQTMDRIFLLVHQFRSFLRTSKKQLGLDSQTSLSIVLQRIKSLLGFK